MTDYTIREATVIDGTGREGFVADVSIAGGRITVHGQGGSHARRRRARTRIGAGIRGHAQPRRWRVHPLPGDGVQAGTGCHDRRQWQLRLHAVPQRAGAALHAGRHRGHGLGLDGPRRLLRCLRKGAARHQQHDARGAQPAPGARRRAGEARRDGGRTGRDAFALRAAGDGAGRIGLSTGLIYEPGRYSDTEEVIALAEECAPFGGLYATHMRNEGDGLLEAVDEAISIANTAGIGLHISHHKSAGKRNWGRVPESLAKVDAANAAGADITLDVYPYTAGSGPMWQYVNLDAIDTEWASNVLIASCPDYREWEGKTIPEIAQEQEWGIEEAVRNILTSERGREVICIHFIIDEADIEANLRHPRMMIGSDGIPDLRGRPHPRLFGTMPRVLGSTSRAAASSAWRRPCDA
ncbi:MAG: hypothetical protein U5Q44_07715 [Dehalococcoidia bacterium]|nr:hypothetical protein [Dehalococcoidia bacterium]